MTKFLFLAKPFYIGGVMKKKPFLMGRKGKEIKKSREGSCNVFGIAVG